MLMKHVHAALGSLLPRRNSKGIVRIPHSKAPFLGTALVSYIRESALAGAKDVLPFHSNAWECYAIITILSKFGFNVDVVDYTNETIDNNSAYDLFFDIHSNLQRHAPFLPDSCIKILHITGSYPQYSISRELERVKAMEMRRGQYYSPKRIVDIGYFQKSLDVANSCSLLGNKHTMTTFPDEYHHKIRMVAPTASYINQRYFYFDTSIKCKNSFIWFYKYGAVHKGLDLLLEIFNERKDLKLHIFGKVHLEKDFIKIYAKELFNTENIVLHGYIDPSSRKFSEIANKCIAFIGPSCSEGTSVAAATCMQAGLFPILSLDNGIDLPKDCGIYLNDCSMENIALSLEKLSNMSMKAIEEQVFYSKEYALEKFSRESFSFNMSDFFASLLNERHIHVHSADCISPSSSF